MNDLASCHIDLDQNHVVPNFADVFPWNHVVPVLEHAAQPAASGHDNGMDMPLALIKN
jgi:hypothetical protein